MHQSILERAELVRIFHLNAFFKSGAMQEKAVPFGRILHLDAASLGARVTVQ